MRTLLIILRRLQRLPVQRRHIRFGTKKVGGSHLHARSAKHERGGNSALVGDPARSDDRYTNCIRHLGHESHGPGLCRDIIREKHSAMAASFEPLGNDGIAASLFQPDRLFHAGRR